MVTWGNTPHQMPCLCTRRRNHPRLKRQCLDQTSCTAQNPEQQSRNESTAHKYSEIAYVEVCRKTGSRL